MKQLVIFRHGPATDNRDWTQSGQEDSHRPLSKEGIQITQKACEGLKRALNLQHPDLDLKTQSLILSSPYTRAKQTADILKQILEVYQDVRLMEQLTPHSPPQHFISLISSYEASFLIAVGHQPHLSLLASTLLSPSQDEASVSLQRAGVLHLQFREEEQIAHLLWLMTPTQLSLLAN